MNPSKLPIKTKRKPTNQEIKKILAEWKKLIESDKRLKEEAIKRNVKYSGI